MERLAPAKINLGLSILGRLPSGYHELHTLFAALEVGDDLRFTPIKEPVIDLRVNGADLSAGPDNLVYKAAQTYLDTAGWPGGIGIYLGKNLPLAAGLGGGSSDAAATLLALAELYPSNLNLPSLALRLGADVPFFLNPGLVEGRGVGEQLVSLQPLPLHLVLVNPGISVSAASAYKELRPEEWGGNLDIEGILQGLQQGKEPGYFNSLEAPVFRLEPSLTELKAELNKVGLGGVLMSGSGSTFFGLASDADEASSIAQKLTRRFPDFWVRSTQTLTAQSSQTLTTQSSKPK
jgi:4-diphosphocytidyl-2-C-methyl-D-erythritol kinase